MAWGMTTIVVVALWSLSSLSFTVESYKPVLIVHGIWDKVTSLDFMADRIREV